MELDYLQAGVLGVIQGITEWLPVSSEGMIVLIQTNFFGQTGLVDAIELAIFLHLGTFFAALIYFRKEVWILLKSLLRYKESEKDNKNILKFLIISTLISGVIGGIFLELFENIESQLIMTTKIINVLIGFLLLGTGFLLYKSANQGVRSLEDINLKDGILLGVIQGFAALPGFSRSGLTVSALLLRKFKEDLSLKLSFLMSLPIVLGANIVLNFGEMRFSGPAFLGLLCAFCFGLLTIDILLKFARKINFSYLVFGFGSLMIISSLI